MIAWLRVGLAGIVILAASILLMPWQLLALRFDWKLRRWLPRIWHRIICFCLGIRIRVHGKMETHRPLMLCANHSSWMDIMVLSSVADVAFIAKIEVRDWPIFGTLAKLQKSVFVVRGGKRKTGHQANEIADPHGRWRDRRSVSRGRDLGREPASGGQILVVRCSRDGGSGFANGRCRNPTGRGCLYRRPRFADGTLSSPARLLARRRGDAPAPEGYAAMRRV